MATIDTKIKYRRQFLPVAKKMMQDGHTLNDLADTFHVCLSTIRKWFEKYPEFKIAVQSGKDEFDIEVLEPLLLEAISPYTVSKTATVTEDDKPVKVTTTVERFKGNPGLMMKWLSVRQPERWRDIQSIEVKGAEGQEERLRAAMLEHDKRIKAKLLGEKEMLF